MGASGMRGYTLVEIIVAMVVFATGALSLAAGSAIVAREMHINGIRAEAARVATSRQEIVGSTCRTAVSGSEARGSIQSRWTVLRIDSIRLSLAGTVSYHSPRGARSESYSVTVGCR
ncbi:MAG TPA: prepilin-type N-terminal cleavage/methylation domain-containing protein [Gemmatimonadaceae bacterium]|nr:prepilin-type N-terminal cleavage/methylation domain-containing protein [Gemmatimonadaceae bacterium]